MKLPDNFPMPASSLGHGAKGMAVHTHRNDEFGVQLEARRERYRHPWVETWTSDHLPDQTFPTFEALREALLAVPDAPAPAWTVISTDPKGEGTSGCYLCRGERGPRAYTVRAKTGWRKFDVAMIPSCEACLPQIQDDPRAAVQARRDWVKAHRVDLSRPA